jgi:hypothetical protein
MKKIKVAYDIDDSQVKKATKALEQLDKIISKLKKNGITIKMKLIEPK